MVTWGRKARGSLSGDSQLPKKRFRRAMKKKSLLKIVAATSVVIFSLLTCFVGTYAWFQAKMNEQTRGDGFAINAGSNIEILSAYAVRYDGNNGALATDVLNPPKKSITMSEYDYIFRDRNVHTPLFFRLEITGFSTSSNLGITISSTGSYKMTSGGSEVIDNNLSNVVSAKFMRGLKVGSSVVVDNKDYSVQAQVKESYEGMLANASTETGTPFVANNAKNSSLTLTLNSSEVYDNAFLIDGVDANNNPIQKAVVFIALDYHVTGTVNLVEDYVNSYAGTGLIHSLIFDADIPSMTLM